MTFDCYNEILRDQLPGSLSISAWVSCGNPLFVEKSGSQFLQKHGGRFELMLIRYFIILALKVNLSFSCCADGD